MAEQGVEIVLVEDDPNDIELMLYALRSHQLTHRLRVVRDGAEALEFFFCTGAYAHRLSVDAPKVVLLDLKLPKVDGLEVLCQLQADSHTHMLPVVMLTSSREERDVVESYRMGVNGYIVKPVDFQQFAEAVQQIGRYWLSPNQPSTL
jgi:CheY-like chemotaxis protein